MARFWWGVLLLLAAIWAAAISYGCGTVGQVANPETLAKVEAGTRIAQCVEEVLRDYTQQETKRMLDAPKPLEPSPYEGADAGAAQ